MMAPRTFWRLAVILGAAVVIGVVYNRLNPNGIPIDLIIF
jgi:hypothetical protein